MLPYFVKSEDYAVKGAKDEMCGDVSTTAAAAATGVVHGVGGEWRVERQRLSWELLDKFRDACAEHGIPKVTDFNKGFNEGSSYFHVNQWNGIRWNTSKVRMKNVREGVGREGGRKEWRNNAGPYSIHLLSRIPPLLPSLSPLGLAPPYYYAPVQSHCSYRRACPQSHLGSRRDYCARRRIRTFYQQHGHREGICRAGDYISRRGGWQPSFTPTERDRPCGRSEGCGRARSTPPPWCRRKLTRPSTATHGVHGQERRNAKRTIRPMVGSCQNGMGLPPAPSRPPKHGSLPSGRLLQERQYPISSQPPISRPAPLTR